MKVFLDTNVLVGAFATRGLSADVLRVVLAEHGPVTSELILDELRRVLAERIGAPVAVIDSAIALLRRHRVEPRPAAPYPLEIEDPDDEWVTASVLSSGADVFVSADKALLDAVARVRGIRALTPRAFWELLSK